MKRVEAGADFHPFDLVDGLPVGQIDAGFLKRRSSIGEAVFNDQIFAFLSVDERRDERLLFSHHHIGAFEPFFLEHLLHRFMPFLVDVSRHNAYLAFSRRDDTRAVGTYQTGRRTFQIVLHSGHILHRNPFGDTDDDPDLRINGLKNGIRGICRRNIDDARIGSCLGNRRSDRAEHRHFADFLSLFPRSHSADDLGSVSKHLGGMERTLVSGDALHENPCAPIDVNAHASGGASPLSGVA